MKKKTYRETITAKHWQEGSGWSYEETLHTRKVELKDEEIKKIPTQKMDLDFWGWEISEGDEDESEDVKLVYELEDADEDIVFTMAVWVSNLVK